MKQEIQNPWTFRKAFNEALKEMQDRTLSEYKKLKQSAKKADALIAKAERRSKNK